jgi:nucleotide-binding universal stress UspA family protein
MFKSILAISEGGPDGAMAYRLAARVGGEFGGTVDAVYFSWKTRDDANLGAQAMPYLADLEKSRLVGRARNAKAAFAEILAASPQNTFDDDSRIELGALVDMGRRADLIVIGRPGADAENPEPPSVSAAIHECARPVMIAPPSPKTGIFSSVVVAWNGSRQASRAVGHALPLLEKASQVSAVVVDDEPEAVRAPLLLEHLARHGVDASLEVIRPHAATGRARGRALLEHAKAAGADLLVMGAYGGGKLKSFLGLGGATAKIISSCPIPLLVAH